MVTPICSSAIDRCTSSSGTYGIQRYEYSALIDLTQWAGCGTDWVIDWDLCCRNNAITSLNNPGNHDLHLSARLNNTLQPCNNSPRFLNDPVPFSCVGQPVVISHGVTDVEGDSLVFSLVPARGTAGATIPYNTGYSFTQPVITSGGANAVSIDPHTGNIYCTPSMPQFAVITVRVNEFRQGVLIGTTYRDIQLAVITCNNYNPSVSGIGGTNNYVYNVCAGTNFCFNVNSTDSDPAQNVTMAWNASISGASFTTTNVPRPVGTFCWTPGQTDAGIHIFTVSVRDNACPLNGTGTVGYLINVTAQQNWYADADGDGAGDAGSTTLACTQPVGYVAHATDCDDTDPGDHPGALDADFGSATGLNGMVQAMALYPSGTAPNVGKVLVGGSFSDFAGTGLNNIARLYNDGQLDTGFAPGTGANSVVSALALQPDGRAVIGGSFTEYDGITRNRIARITTNGGLDASFAPGSGANQHVSAVVLQPDGRILIGGQFTNYNGTARSRIARINADGSLDGSFDPGSGAGAFSVDAIGIRPDGRLIIGGSFSAYNGIARGRIAGLLANGALDASFDPGTGANGPVTAVLVQPDGKVVIGGQFTAYNGTARNRIARLNADGNLDATFAANGGLEGLNGVSVRSLALAADGRIVVAGEFDTFDGIARKNIVRLNSTGGLDTSFNPGTGTDQSIWAMAVQPDGKVLLGGQFSSYDGVSRSRVARIHGDCLEPEVYDCPYIEANIGDACDDGDASTENDLITVSCACAGTPVLACTTDLTLEFRSDAPEQTTWEIRDAGTNAVLRSGGPLNGSPETNMTCLPDGCYVLRVLDSGGDGMVGGGYVLRTSGPNGQRIIDNSGNFTSGGVSRISDTYDNGAFCLPLGSTQLIHSSCDKLDWTANKFIVVGENVAVSAQYGVANATSGYEFWFFDPNGGYSFRSFRSHSTSDGYGTGALRANHFKINGWTNSVSTPHLPANRLLNVRVRGRVAGTNLEFGPACQFKIDAVLAACPRVKLQDDPFNTKDYSCGVTRNFGGVNSAANRITANPPQPIPTVASANVRYQFRFRIPGEGICIVRPPQTSARLQLNWTAASGAPLLCGKTYDVDVRVSLDGGATWCFGPGSSSQVAACADSEAWGKVCKLTISACAQATGGSSSMVVDVNSSLTMYPNPNRGDQLFVSLSTVEEGVSTVSVDIFDLTGKKVTARTIAVQASSSRSGGNGFVKTALELNGELANGMYLVNITAGSAAYTERLVIQK